MTVGATPTSRPRFVHDQSICVALSGGGYRAVIFGLGVLLYLVDSGLNKHVKAIVSVSGGSWLNGLVGLACNFRTAKPAEFESIARRVISETVYMERSKTSFILLLSSIVLALLGLALLGPVDLVWWKAILLVVTCSLLGTYALRFNFHYQVSRVFIKSSMGAPILADLKQGDRAYDRIEHVICATDLEAGDPGLGRHIFFSGTQVYSPVYGRGSPANVPLVHAVAASAAFPFVFRHVRIRVRQIDFDKPPRRRRRFVYWSTQWRASIKLGDGGIHDNLGLPWLDIALAGGLVDAKRVIVVNSGAPYREYRPLGWLPWMRSAQIMHNSNVASRLASAKLRFLTGGSSSGAVISVGDSIDEIITEVCGRNPSSKRADSCSVDIATHPLWRYIAGKKWSHGGHWPLSGELNEPTNWSRLRDDACAVPTTVFRLNSTDVERLLFHGYSLALASTYHYLYPMRLDYVGVRTLDHIRKLVVEAGHRGGSHDAAGAGR